MKSMACEHQFVKEIDHAEIFKNTTGRRRVREREIVATRKKWAAMKFIEITKLMESRMNLLTPKRWGGFIFWVIFFLQCPQGNALNLNGKSNPLVIEPLFSTQESSASQKFLASLHRIVLGKFDASDIVENLNWIVLKVNFSKFDNSEEVIFKMYENWGNPQYFRSGNGKKEFSAQLESEYICIKGIDVLKEFGNSFERSVWNADAWKDDSRELIESSDEVKENFRIFSWGPRYVIQSKELKFGLLFDFKNSICARGFRVYQID